ncbi:uncharacterized protein LOC105203959 [Solenopsis invicta]|uniref:uncharacterized protein LOC105203959 n=1 Tax=Solenopsis invicta TaxID=13686 RepID=UPI000595B975|nr:uncharacterized protein LOC105203959 [Solenopsis invicta]
MYRTVIICLIVIGCVGAISPYHDRIVREAQEPTPAEFIYPTYPEYTTEVMRPNREIEEKVEDKKAPATTSKFFDNLRYYGSYALQGMAVILMSSSVAYLICGYTTVCDSIKSMLSKEEAARAFANQPYLEDLASKVYAAMEKYSMNKDE